jgi:hypothetical protein
MSADLRVSDQEREQAAQQLREHYAAGRITEDELNQRVEAVYVARSQQQLAALLSDLPALPATPQQLKAELVQRRSELRRRLLQESGGGLAIFAVCVVVWAANGIHATFWPGWVALFVVLPVIRNGWRLYGPAPELDRVERELERRARHQRRRGHRGHRGR